MDAKLTSGIGSKLDSGAYSDLNRLANLKVGQDRDSEGNIKKVAQEFESLFLNQMLKAMRSANEAFSEGNFMNSNEAKTYQQMYDQELAVKMSKEGGIGLADVLARQMSKMKAPTHKANPFAHGDEVNAVNATAAAGATTASDTSNKTLTSHAIKELPAVDKNRDDSKLLNKRRLSLPGTLSDRLLAGIVPTTTAGATNDGKPLAQNDWLAANNTSNSTAIGSSKKVDLNAIDASSGRRLAQPPLAPGKAAFKSADEFISTMLPMAQQAAAKIGVDPAYLVAQAALETGWGKSIIRDSDGSSSHNLFGIKAAGGWDGDSARAVTTEYKGGQAVKEAAAFRSYDSFQESFNDYVSFLQDNDRYDKALDKTANPKQFVRELQQAGYATDPQYANKVAQIAKQMQTYQTIAAGETTATRL
ncbi:flagellar assembly peptidoglycan hydrolase FlgJ [Pseudomonas turukhanskensis]|uniref:Peptidoglycan hydrolase FlgJ n=1 Tax=Pseudomonas turukhanskensis TaxID=1806536 RepID=A0A9W6NG34_9PSED|nr:flagellar assembly peptidoglycan hydrolase FlgJ [Pseudomonas turukhanskensis]GLK89442.1 peptidoglycan hydrolase FlgJ [Pseudomonas turukhanskensis]